MDQDFDLDLGSAKTHKIRIDGVGCEVREPNLDDSEWYEKQQNKKGSTSSAALISYLARLGIPEQSARKLDQGQAKDLIDYLSSVSLKKSAGSTT